MRTRRTPTDFGERLRRHRLAAGLSQWALSRRADVSRGPISDLETGRRGKNVGRDVSEALTRALGAPLPAPELHLYADDCPGGRVEAGRVTRPSSSTGHARVTTIDLGLDDGRRLFLHLGEASLTLLTHLFEEYARQREDGSDGDFDARMFAPRPVALGGPA